MHNRIKTEMEKWLKAHGYEKQPETEADFLVTYYSSGREKNRGFGN